jgi:hypothetical protein
MNGPSTGNGNQTIPIPREAFHRFSSSGARRAEDGFDKVNKRKPVGFKDKLKREEAGIVKRRSGAVLARGWVNVLVQFVFAQADEDNTAQIHLENRSAGRFEASGSRTDWPLAFLPDHYPTGKSSPVWCLQRVYEIEFHNLSI